MCWTEDSAEVSTGGRRKIVITGGRHTRSRIASPAEDASATDMAIMGGICRFSISFGRRRCNTLTNDKPGTPLISVHITQNGGRIPGTHNLLDWRQ